MAQTIQIHLKSSIFDKEKLLTINPSFIEFDKVILQKSEIAGLRYGIKSIRGYTFRIGRIYCIDIRNLNGDIIKIRLKSLYRVRRILLAKKYKQIVEAIFDNYINDISRDFIKKFNNKNDFKLLGNTFTQEGIILYETNEVITWLDLGTKNYYSYYSLFSITNPNKNKSFYYLADWNTIVLLSVSRHILKSKKLL